MPLHLLLDLRAGADPEITLAKLVEQRCLGELLDDITSLEAFLEAGLNPNAKVEELPLLAKAMVLNGAHSHEAIAVLTAYGADWGTLVPVTMGLWPDEYTVMVPIAHAMLYLTQSSAYWPCVAIRECGLDPGLVDPEWGGNLAHHAAASLFYLSSCYGLGQAGVDLDQVAEGDEAVIARAKMVGDWLPEFAGKTARQICEVRAPGGLAIEAWRAAARAERGRIAKETA